MIVLTLTECPNALRGDLTRWLFQVDTNIYVGKQSARVRDRIWERVTETAGNGRAVMVFPTNNEQGFDFRVFGSTWEPIDFDGLKLMLRPHPEGMKTVASKIKPGFSKAAKRQSARRFANKKRSCLLPDTYIVVDVETTGLSPDNDEIIEIGAQKIVEGVNTETFQAFIRTKRVIPIHIEQLTGIENETLKKDGRELKDVVHELNEFIEELPIVSHNVDFDMAFLRKAYERCTLSMPSNSCIDTLRMARKLLDDPPDYKLGTLVKYFNMEHIGAHRSIGDCDATKLIYDKLRSISSDGVEESE